MSFIGADGQDHLIKSLKAQVTSKDGELASVRNELAKCKQSLEEEKKQRMGLEYQINMDAQGAETTGKNTIGMKNEIAQLKQNLFNRETSLNTANETIKRLEKDKSGLEYDLQIASSSSGDATRLLNEQKTKLENEVKTLKQELQRKESEEARNKAASAKVAAESGIPVSNIPRLRRAAPTSNIFGASTPSSEAGPSRRCSTSLANGREAELTKEVAVLKTQVAGQKVKVDKLINERIAIERGAKKKEEELNDRIEEMKDELDFYRSNAGAGGPDPKKAKELEEEIAKLGAANNGLSKELEVIKAQKDGLDAEVKRIQELEMELEGAHSAVTSSATPTADAETDQALRTEIEYLRTQIAEQGSALAAATASSSLPESDRVLDLTKQIRQLKRDNDMAKHLVKTAESERDEIEAENAQLNKRLQSVETGPASTTYGEVESLRIALKEAESKVANHQQEADRLELLVRDEQAAKGSLVAEIETTKGILLEVQTQANAAKEALDQAVQQQEELRTQLEDARRSVEESQNDLSATKSELQSALADAEVGRNDAQSARQLAEEKVADLEEQLAAKSAQLAEVLASARASSAKEIDLQSTVDMATTALAEMEARAFGHKEERDQAREKSIALEKQVAAVQAKLEEAEQVRDATLSELGHLEATLQATHTELEDSQAALAKQNAEVERLADELQTTASDNARLEQKLAELEESLANRSTETESQHRQEEVFQLKDDLESAQREKRKMQSAERERLDEIEAKRSEIAAALIRIGQLEELVGTLEAQLVEAKATPPIEVNLTAQPKEEADPSHANLLHGMIERLRTERDELRQTASFAKHEHRFALQASEADRATTAEKLQLAQREAKSREVEFGKKMEELQTLQTQITDTAVELDDLRSRLMAQSDDEKQGAELARKIGALETDLQKVQDERNSLKEEVEHLGRVRDAAVNDLDAFRYQSTEALKREAKLQQDLNRLRSEREEGKDLVPAATPTLRSPVEMTFSRPTSANGVYDLERRRLGHSRRQSLADLRGEQPAKDAAALMTGLQTQLKSEEERVKSLQNKLHAEIARREEEVRRVQRREQTIAQLREEKRIAEERIVIPEVDADVTIDDSGTAQIAALQIQIESLQAASAASLAQYESAKAGIETALQQAQTQRDELSTRLAALHSESNAQLEAVEMKNASLSTEVDNLGTAKDRLTSEIDQLIAERKADAEREQTLDARINELEAELSTIREQTAAVTAERDAMQVRLSADQDSIRIEMEELFSSKHTLEKKVYKLEGVERSLLLQLEDLGAEATSAADARAHEKDEEAAERKKLEGSLQEATARLEETKSSLDQLRTTVGEKDGRVQYLTELVDDLTAEVALWEANHTSALHDQDVLSERLAASAREKEAVEVERQQLAGKLADMRYSEEEAAQMSTDRDLLRTKLAETVAELDALRADSKAADLASKEKTELAEQTVELEARISELTADAAALPQLRAEKDAFSAQVAAMETRIAQLSSTENDLRAQLDTALSAQKNAVSELAEKLEISREAQADLSVRLAVAKEAKDSLEVTATDNARTIEQLEQRIAALDETEADLRKQLAIAHNQQADNVLAAARQAEQLEQAHNTSTEQSAIMRDLTTKLEEAEKRILDGSADGAQIKMLEADRRSLEVELDGARLKLASSEASIAQLSARLEESERMKGDLEGTKEAFASDLKAARVRLTQMEEERTKLVPSSDLENVTEELAAMKRDLAMAQDSSQEAERLVMSKESIIAELRNANEEYSRKLTSMTAATLSAADKEEVSELKEKIEHLELSLEQRNAECEAYDDRLAEASSALKALKRKHDKMVREVKKKEKDDELARITALNVKLSKPTAEEAAPKPSTVPARSGPTSVPSRVAPVFAAPAPTPASAQTATLAPSAILKATAAPNATTRAPLRKVSAFDEQMPTSFATAFSPLVGTKRGREGDDAIKPVKTDAIMQPPSAHTASAPFKLPPAQPRMNAFADTGKENTGKMSEMSLAGAGVRRSAVPMRNVFSPEP